MAGSNGLDTNVLKLIFNATNWANIADNTATSPATVLYVSLHTADPTKTGNQTSSEATYTGYARVSVARTTGGWTVSGSTTANVVNAGTITFPLCTGGSNTITYFGVGLASSGTGTLLFSGALTASLAVSNGITPNYNAGDLTITAD